MKVVLIYEAFAGSEITRCACPCFHAALVRSPLNRFLVDVHEIHEMECPQLAERVKDPFAWSSIAQLPAVMSESNGQPEVAENGQPE